jgi:hypothetical protein
MTLISRSSADGAGDGHEKREVRTNRTGSPSFGSSSISYRDARSFCCSTDDGEQASRRRPLIASSWKMAPTPPRQAVDHGGRY